MSALKLFGAQRQVASFRGVARTASSSRNVRPGATTLIALSITLKC